MLKRTTANAQQFSQEVASYAAKLNDKGTLANDLVSDTSVFSSLRTTMAKLQDVANRTSAVVDNVNATAQSLNANLNSPSTPAGLLLNDRQSADKIRITLQNLQSSSQKLDEDLEAVQHNFLLRGFFKKRAKEQEKAAKQAAENTQTTPQQQ